MAIASTERSTSSPWRWWTPPIDCEDPKCVGRSAESPPSNGFASGCRDTTSGSSPPLRGCSRRRRPSSGSSRMASRTTYEWSRSRNPPSSRAGRFRSSRLSSPSTTSMGYAVRARCRARESRARGYTAVTQRLHSGYARASRARARPPHTLLPTQATAPKHLLSAHSPSRLKEASRPTAVCRNP